MRVQVNSLKYNKLDFKKIGKSNYKSPEITMVKLDNEISLSMESDPAIGPDESLNNIESFKKVQFENNHA